MVTQIWYSEIKNVNFLNLEESEFCDNFTQIIWVDTQNFGIAKHLSKNGFIYIVARYWPPGNFIDKYYDNVFPENSTLKIRSNFHYITVIEIPSLFKLFNYTYFRQKNFKEKNDQIY